MPLQSLPDAEHRCHWYLNEVGLFDHVPFVAVSVWPSRAVLAPVIVGSAVFAGAAAMAVAARRPASTPSASSAQLGFRTRSQLIQRSFQSTSEESRMGLARGAGRKPLQSG